MTSRFTLSAGATILSVLLIASPMRASIVDHQALLPPSSRLVDTFSGRIVASDHGWFFAQGTRLSPDGSAIDEEPISEAGAHAVAWHDGWLLVESGAETRIKHLGETGPAAPVLDFPSKGTFQDAASVAGRLAILESDPVEGNALWITVTDDREVITRERIASGRSAKIVRLGDGFLAVWSSGDGRSILTAARIDAEGNVLRSRELDLVTPYTVQHLTASPAGRALMVTSGVHNRTRVIDENLDTSSAMPFIPNATPRVNIAPPLSIEAGFLVPYGVREGFGSEIKEYRARIVRLDGSYESDGTIDPIVGGDRFGDRYLVARPWGDVVIAAGDPRAVVSAPVRARLRVYETWESLATVISGDVTLVMFGHWDLEWFIRVDSSGRLIDSEPQPLPRPYNNEYVPNQVTPMPDGFGFMTRTEGGQVGLRRLTRRGGWLDAEPVILATDSFRYGFAIHANGYNLLVAWTTPDEIVWQLLAYDGKPLQAEVGRVAHPPPGRDVTPSGIGIAGHGTNRLIVVQERQCVVGTCTADPPRFEIVALDGAARPLGPLNVRYGTTLVNAIGLHDGTWAVPFSELTPCQVLHADRNGTTLEVIEAPDLCGGFHDLEPTANGWRAIVGGPSRLVDVEGAAKVTRVTGLDLPRLLSYSRPVPRGFMAGGKLAYLDASPENATLLVPWSGRVFAEEGDLSMQVTDLGRSGTHHHFVAAVTNETNRTVRDTIVLMVGSEGSTETSIPVMKAGETVRFNLAAEVSPYRTFDPRFLVVSDDVADVDPSDNVVTFSQTDPRPDRHRPSRR